MLSALHIRQTEAANQAASRRNGRRSQRNGGNPDLEMGEMPQGSSSGNAGAGTAAADGNEQQQQHNAGRSLRGLLQRATGRGGDDPTQQQGATAGPSPRELAAMSRRRRAQYERDHPAPPTSADVGGFVVGGPGGLDAENLVPTLTMAQTRALALSERRRLKDKREKDEAATLFGPVLSNYFGSGSSSSGAVNGGSVAAASAAGANGADTAAGAGETSGDAGRANGLLAPPSAGATGNSAAAAAAAAAARQPRLGSRGRARGASLSGLSMSSLNAAYNADAASPAEMHPSSSSYPFGLAPYDLETPALVDRAQDSTLAMADGIEIDTLHRWVDRTVGFAPAHNAIGAETPESEINKNSKDSNKNDAVDAATPAPVICSTLQAFVNFKRNAIKLTPIDASADAGVTVTGSAADPLTAAPPPTHALQFEYDCAAPNASVSIFLRASRKHGSWLNQAQVDAHNAAAGTSGAPKFYAQRGPPPHVLGFPVHGTIVKRGFSSKSRANIALKLALFAPPGATKGKAGEAVSTEVGTTAEKDGAGAPASPTMAPHPTEMAPDFEPLDLVPTHELDSALANREAAAAANANRSAPTASTTAAPTEPLSKEARLAKEKQERQTLKMAIVMEALDEDGESGFVVVSFWPLD